VTLIAAAEGRYIPRSTVYAVVVATTLAQIASVMGIAVFPVIAPRLASEIGIAPAMIGYQISLIYGAATVGSPLMSFAVTRWGACRATQVGLVCTVAAMALALTASVWALVAASILLGVSMTLMTPASTHLLFRFSPPQNRNLIFSIKQTGVPGGWVVMALVAPPITLSFGWRWSTVLVLVIALILIVALQPVRAQWDDDRKPGAAVRVDPIGSLVALWRHRPLRWLAAAALTLSFVQLCLGTFLVTMLVQEADYSLVAAGVMLSVVQASGVGGRILWGWVADRTANSLGVLQKIAAPTTVCCVVIAFLTPEWPQPLIALFFVVFGAAAVGWNGLFLAEVARRSPRGQVSQSTSAAMTWTFAGILLGPAIFAAVFGATGSYSLTYLMLAFVSAAGFALLALSGAAGRRERAAA
jgi:MFS family permease